MTLTTIWRRTQPVGLLPDLADAGLAMIQCRLNAFAEASVAFEQVVEDQGKITLGFCRKEKKGDNTQLDPGMNRNP